MNEKLRKDLKSLAADYEKNPAVALLAMRVLKELGTPEPTPTGETVRVGIYRSPDSADRFYVFGSTWQGEPPVLDMFGSRRIGLADIPLPRIPVVEARVVEEKS